MRPPLITGCAGFIGSTLCKSLINQGHFVIGIDNLTKNYPIKFKKDNLAQIGSSHHFHFYQANILNYRQILTIFQKYQPHTVIHLAALTGVRASLRHPDQYFDTNVIGTKNVYLATVSIKGSKFIFTSSSSVYGNSSQIPFFETQKLNPLSPYAESKFEAEILLKKLRIRAKIPTTILRLFSVYGPFGRPDMAPYLFTQAAFSRKEIDIFGDGQIARDYTYIDDVIKALQKCLKLTSLWEIINIGNSSPVTINHLINTIERLAKKKISMRIKSKIKEEPLVTYANINKAKAVLSWQPKTSFETGMKKFISWYRQKYL